MAYSKLQWETLIRHLAVDSSQIIFTKHVLIRMKQRHITQAYVLEVLRHGVIRREPEQDIKRVTRFAAWSEASRACKSALCWRWKTQAQLAALWLRL